MKNNIRHQYTFLPLLVLLLVMLPIMQVFGQSKWELARSAEGIKVFTSKEAASKFKAIKVEAVLPGSLEKLLYLLTDADTNKDWIYNTKESFVIKKVNKFESISYTETAVPWPASNRDLPLNVSVNLDEKAQSLKVTARGVPNAVPIKKGIVRIPYFNSSWHVTSDGKNLVINYFLEMDPGGSLPAWITNMFVAKGPFETFSNLAKLLRQSR